MDYLAIRIYFLLYDLFISDFVWDSIIDDLLFL